MITVTAPDGSKINLDGKLVVRARRTVVGERGGDNRSAETRVDWAIMSLVTEPLDEVVAKVKRELRSFTALTARDGSRIWFNAKKVVGPLPITAKQRTGGIRSSIKLMNYRQFVKETPNEVREVLKKAGGSPL